MQDEKHCLLRSAQSLWTALTFKGALACSSLRTCASSCYGPLHETILLPAGSPEAQGKHGAAAPGGCLCAVSIPGCGQAEGHGAHHGRDL